MAGPPPPRYSQDAFAAPPAYDQATAMSPYDQASHMHAAPAPQAMAPGPYDGGPYGGGPPTNGSQPQGLAYQPGYDTSGYGSAPVGSGTGNGSRSVHGGGCNVAGCSCTSFRDDPSWVYITRQTKCTDMSCRHRAKYHNVVTSDDSRWDTCCSGSGSGCWCYCGGGGGSSSSRHGNDGCCDCCCDLIDCALRPPSGCGCRGCCECLGQCPGDLCSAIGDCSSCNACCDALGDCKCLQGCDCSGCNGCGDCGNCNCNC
eukprot:c11779_g1_i1.p2 GENE.c11779_g1_i1~~c11779_g1_i1.p2  ORF type:complete len:257 (+),score=10.95 c11779_g1_i1:124-894(+)